MGISNSDGDGGGDRWRWLQGHFPVPAGCRNRDFLSPKSPLRWWRCCGTFYGFLIDYLGFMHREASYRRRGKVGGRPGGPHHLVARPGLARATTWCGRPVAPLRIVFWLRVPHGKILTLPFVLSNFENIDFLTFLEPKTTENMQLALWHLVNRLVLENV